MIRRIRQALADRLVLVRALRADCQRMHTDLEPLEEALQRAGERNRRLEETIADLRRDNERIQAAVLRGHAELAAARTDLLALRDGLTARRQRIERAQLAGDAA